MVTVAASPVAMPRLPLNVGVALLTVVPLAGDASVTAGAVVSTVQLRVVTVLTLPAASRAFTWKLWLPSRRPLKLFGLAQALKPPPSSWQRKEVPASVSEKAKLGLVEETVPLGPESMDGAGGAVVSIVQLRVVIVLSLPAASRAFT